MNKQSKFIAVILFASVGSTSAGELHPSLFELEIGQPYAYKIENTNIDNDRPTTQFRAPNYGKSASIFSEYEVISLNSTSHVVSINAEVATLNLNECMDNRSKVVRWINEENPNFKAIPINESQLDNANEIGNSESNTYYRVECVQAYGPFTTLRLSIRGKNEDKQLKEAWKKFFKK